MLGSDMVRRLAADVAPVEFLRLLRLVTGERCRISFSMGDQLRERRRERRVHCSIFVLPFAFSGKHLTYVSWENSDSPGKLINISRESLNISRETATKFDLRTLPTHQKALEDPGGATDGVGILCGGGSTVNTISFFSPIAATHAHMRLPKGVTLVEIPLILK